MYLKVYPVTFVKFNFYVIPYLQKNGFSRYLTTTEDIKVNTYFYLNSQATCVFNHIMQMFFYLFTEENTE